MTTQEIQQLLNIADSTLSDWENSPKRKNLVRLLRALKSDDVANIINAKNPHPKYSEHTRTIRLSKKLFTKDLFWSRQDGSMIDIKNLITVYLSNPNQEDTEVLINLFGYTRVLSVLNQIRPSMYEEDYSEALEQIQYAQEPEIFYTLHTIPPIEEIVKKPKQRYINQLIKHYNPSEIIKLAQKHGAPFSSIFQIKKMTGDNA
jgi:hypothetical protein